MFISEEKLEVTQISLTGTRALALIGLLIIEPLSFEEIRKKFLEMGIFEEKNSDDILRIDLNTIKSMGCELSRPCISNGYKYVLKKHPFSLNIDRDDVKLLKRAYTKIKNNITLEVLIEYDELLKKIAEFVYDEEVKEYLLGISVLKYYDIDEIKELIKDCKTQKIIELVYKNPETKKDNQKILKLEKLVFQNDKIYLYGFDTERQFSTVLLYKRIKKIISKKQDEKFIQPRNIEIIYKLRNFDKNLLLDNEKIIEEKNDNIMIQGTFYNDFLAIQRVLSLGSKCTIISPLEIKDAVISKLKAMKEVYNG